MSSLLPSEPWKTVFYDELLKRTGVATPDLLPRDDPAGWSDLSARLRAVVRSRTKQEWTELLEGTDVCFAPVLSVDEAPEHPHMKARNVFVEAHGMLQPAPAPRFSRSKPTIRRPPPTPGQHTREILQDIGYDERHIAALFANGSVV